MKEFGFWLANIGIPFCAISLIITDELAWIVIAIHILFVYHVTQND